MAHQVSWDSFIATVADFLGLEPEKLNKETNIYNDLGLDSLGVFSLGMTLLKEYSITVPLSVVSTITTIGEMYAAMLRQVPSNQEVSKA
jgi:acyl carrier protein